MTRLQDAGPVTRRADRSLALLTAGQSLYFAGVSIDLTLTGVVGIRLTPTPALATLPLAMITVVGTAGAVAAGLITRRFGYPRVVAGSALFALIGGLVSAWAVSTGSFALFCCGTGLVGIYRAGGGYLRYLAVETAPPGRENRALSMLLAGGFVAAFVGPLIAVHSAALLPVRDAGAFLAISVMAATAVPLVLLVREPQRQPKTDGDDIDGAAKRVPLPVAAVRRRPEFVAGMLMLGVSGAAMTMTMAIGPIASAGAGHSMSMGAEMIQWHLVAMFAPSIASGFLLTHLGVRRTGLFGAVLLAAGALAGGLGDSSAHFMIALVLDGVGWNLLYLSGTSAIVKSYPPGRGSRVQALAEGVAAGTAVLATFAASGVFDLLGWRGANIAPLTLGVLLTVVLLVLRLPDADTKADSEAENDVDSQTSHDASPRVDGVESPDLPLSDHAVAVLMEAQP